MPEPFFLPGKASMVIDGQLGSTGKGAILSYLMENEELKPDIAVSVLSPNAGHTVHSCEYGTFVSKQVPICGIMDRRNLIYIAPGAVLEPVSFFNELAKFDIDPERVRIHPRVAVITERELESEKLDANMTTICSTMSGTGAARATKVLRTNRLAQGVPELKPFLSSQVILLQNLDAGCSAMIETGQGMDLSINAGLSYPFCTSKDILPAQILADCMLHPYYLGSIMATFRTYPIRVGNIVKDGQELGHSGPFPPDSREITFDDLGVKEEYTTVTGRIRRIATFSKQQWNKAHCLIKPTHTFLNFVNYMSEEEFIFFDKLLARLPNSYIGYGAHAIQIRPYTRGIFEGLLK